MTHKLPTWLLPTPPRTDEPRPVNGMKPLLLKLMSGQDLSREESCELLNGLLDGEATDAQIAAALVALAVKGETVEELAGLAQAMRARAQRIHSSHPRLVDTAGTGSSKVKTFNVSTAAALVAAGAGTPIAKHGSRAATSRSGSADVLTALGVKVDPEPALAERCLNELGICFMFAPVYHKATARVAAVRRQLGVHTTFNLLGPLTNPAGAKRQIIGVWQPSLVRHVAEALALLGAEFAWVVHGLDGLDEITLAGKTKVAQVENGKVTGFNLEPQDLGLERHDLSHLRGGDPAQNASIIRAVLEGKGDPVARELIIANAAAALYIGGAADDPKAAAELAAASIDNGRALQKLEQLAERTRSHEGATGHIAG